MLFRVQELAQTFIKLINMQNNRIPTSFDPSVQLLRRPFQPGAERLSGCCLVETLHRPGRHQRSG